VIKFENGGEELQNSNKHIFQSEISVENYKISRSFEPKLPYPLILTDISVSNFLGLTVI